MAYILASTAGPTLEIAGILQSPLGENNTGFPLGPQGADDNRRQTGGFHLEDDISVWFDVCQDHRLPRRLNLVSIVGAFGSILEPYLALLGLTISSSRILQ